MPAKMSHHQMLALDALRNELAAAPHGGKRAPVQLCANSLNVSEKTVRRWLADNDLVNSTRKQRSDAGSSKVSKADLVLLSVTLSETMRQNGNRIMTMGNALETLQANGVMSSPVSASRASILLTQRGFHPRQLWRPTPAVAQRSLHPNHVWQVDASVCIAYYLSNATGMKVMDEKKFYKNKPGNVTRIQAERLIRYAVVDHTSHALLTRYYLGSECSEHLADFLMWAFGTKGERSADHLMHGVPLILMMDMGSANTSRPVLNLLERLAVRTVIHERHNSRANGSVEKAHHLIEVNFESSLRFQHVSSLDDLNAKALAWAHHFCATRKHTRYSDTRYSAWLTITAEQLRLAPAQDVMRDLVRTHPQERRVSNNLTVSFVPRKGQGSEIYSVHKVPGVMAGAKLRVVVNPYRVPAIDVEYVDALGEQHWMTVNALERNELGFYVDAPVIGQDYHQGPKGIIDRAREQVLVAAYSDAIPDTATTHTDRVAAAEAAKEAGALVFGGSVDPFKRVADANLPTFMPKRGTELDAPATRRVEVARLSTFEACSRIHAGLKRLGAAHAYDAATVYPWIEARFGAEGMPEDQLDATCQLLMANAARPAGERNDTPLRAIAGGGNGGTDA